MNSKKGQGLSLNVIIVAALALIVLVVLIMVFTGRIGIFQSGLDKESRAELVKMKIYYGDCHPTATAETTFTTEYSQAESEEAKEISKAKFSEDWVDHCKSFSDKGACESGGCKWK
ncbi:MAG: hypothetical protein ABH824_03950 [Nanoarchaeota archaeon]|nr:hypothetical protein [Nanoarchaeota archaeon]MBU1632561.1 hypothetical protein [Nanoarchaeota archaeon]MBU1876580.1 hypothetical protein [Nanoarchaeota archaeon]